MSKSLIIGLATYCLLLHACIINKIVSPKSRKDTQSSAKEVIALDAVTITPKRHEEFRGVPVKQIDIIHTDLDVSFNWGKHECIGKASLLLKPYFYETDSINLDAKNMTFGEITITDMNGEPIHYLTSYDKKKLHLKLEKKLSAYDSVQLVIRYTARPDESDGKNNGAIRDDKGLYFINTDNSEPFKPIQIWTQGEPESNSCWFPTIDQPNEKFTIKLAITVNKDFTTLSNGILTSSTTNGILKTDVWESAKPMSAYLVMMAIGNFKVSKDFLTKAVKDSFVSFTYDTIRIATNDTLNPMRDSIVATQRMNYTNTTKDLLNGVEISYVLEPDFAPYAMNIFKHTPEMVHFFSSRFGVPYPWEKYAQVVVHDFVAGAMENTTATLHNESVQKNNRELLDANNDEIISHELVHQWFGDLVTCKSWSHLTLNEGFASYGEQLWLEYKYGKDAGLKKSYQMLDRYLNYAKESNDDPIIQFNYKNADAMFNSITYQKGALVLNLLRSVLGDQAFFQALKNYLTANAFENAEIDDLRRACENVSGKDLRPFFNQWFLKGGHPSIEIRYDYIDSTKLVAVTIEQKQSKEIGLFTFPLKFKVTQAGKTTYFTFDISKRVETFYVRRMDNEVAEYPNVFVDPDGTFIGEIKDNKPFINHIKSYYSAVNYIEKFRSLKELNTMQATIDTARSVILHAVSDANPDIRAKAIEWINWSDERNSSAGLEQLIRLAKTDSSTIVRVKATAQLAQLTKASLLNILLFQTNDSSYSVAAKALRGVYRINREEALRRCNELERDARRDLFTQISSIYASAGSKMNAGFFETTMMKVAGRARASLIDDYVDFCERLNVDEVFSKAITILTDRAENDGNGLVRVTAIGALNSFCQKQQADNDNQKDAVKKAERQIAITSFKQKIQLIVDQEKESGIVELLKLRGLTQTHDIREDR